MRKNVMRLLSAVICLAMVLSMLPVTSFAAETTTLYCQAPDSWDACSVYWWGSSDSNPEWPGEEMWLDENDIWFLDIPADAEGVIFNDTGSNQTNNLTIPTDENVMYLYANKTWTVYGRVDVETFDYYVAGESALCGADWVADAKANGMTDEDGDGVYELTYARVEAGTYQFKVTDGTWNNTWGNGSDNYSFTVTAAGMVTICFDAASHTVSVVGNTVETQKPETSLIQTVYLVGDAGLTGANWDVKANQMSQSNGIYSITFIDVAAGTYAFRFAANGSEALTWGTGAELEPNVQYNAVAGSANSSLTVPKNNSTVTLIFDLSDSDPETGDGAKCSYVLEDQSVEVITQGMASFKNAATAAEGYIVSFTAKANGAVTLRILSCAPGFLVNVIVNNQQKTSFEGNAAQTVSFDVSGGSQVQLQICGYRIESETVKYPAAGEVAYKVLFVSDSEEPDDEAPVLPDDLFDQPGSTMANPKVISGPEWTNIPGNTTVWYLYDNYQNMMDKGIYAMMLNITSDGDYYAAYYGEEIYPNVNGMVAYKLDDQFHTGKYLFCVTNESAGEQFFSIELADYVTYTNDGEILVLGRNNLQPDTSVDYTLYEFCPEQTGIYRFVATKGLLGDWGTSFNPVNNSVNKTSALEWTCTSEGQSILVGVTGTASTVVTVTRIGNYVPDPEIPYEIYENTYDFSYQLPADGKVVEIDLLDGKYHSAHLGEDGFYHYDSVCGPIMVANLSGIAEFDFEDAYINGGLRVWFQDENGATTLKIDYNEALYAYYEAGLVPVTEELAIMLSRLGENKLWWEANGIFFGDTVPKDLSKAWMQLCGYMEGTGGHDYIHGTCSVCGNVDSTYVSDYYLFGYINGANYGCEEDFNNMGEYHFVNNKLTATFTQDSYVAVKTSGNGVWYMTKGWVGIDVTSAVLYDTSKEAFEGNKLFVPADVKVEFTLTQNLDGTLTLSYEKLVCNHSYQASVTEQPTCEAEGLKTFTCSACGNSYTEAIPANGHAYGLIKTTKATCEADGMKTFSCANCGKTKTEILPATGHSYQQTSVTQPTCEVDGKKVSTCGNCGKTKTEILPATDHDYELTKSTQASCEQDGGETFTCGNCGDVYTEVFPATGHSYNQTGVTQPTCDKDGKKSFICGNCGKTKTEVLPAIGHDYELTKTTQATCETDGMKTFTCGNCGKTKTEVLPATGHAYVQTEMTHPTCDQDGQKVLTCSNCKATKTESIPAIGHAYELTKTTQATCEADGVKTFTCSNCKATKTETIPAIGHVYAQTETTLPTCEKDGQKVLTCTNCGATKTEVLPATGHSYADGKCTVCGAAAPDVDDTYYLFGYINGANYACEEDYENMGQYKFVDGKLTATFTADSYVGVKTEGNGTWFMTNGWLGNETTSTVLYDTSKEQIDANKLFVPANVELNFTLVENADGTLTLSYEKGAASYQISFVVPEGVAPVEDMTCGAAGITLPTAGVPAGEHSYVFAGWAEQQVESTTTAPTIYTGTYTAQSDITLYALYTYSEGGSGDGGWKLVTSAAQLAAGDTLVMAENTKGKVISEITKQYFSAVDAVFSEDGSTLTQLPEGAVTLTLGKNGDFWTLTSASGQLLGCTSAKKLAWDKESTLWTISIDEAGAATVASSEETYGRFLYNVNNPRFTTYTSNATAGMLLPQLYKLSAAAGDTYYTTLGGAADPGVAVSGTVTSGRNTTGTVTVELWLEGADKAAYTVTTENGTYTLEGVAAGTYTMKISKVNHVTRSYTVTVGSEAVTQNAKICLIGDVTGDGQINIGDVGRLYSHVKGTNLITDEYAIQCGNVNGGSLNIGDPAGIYAHVKGTRPLF